MKAIAKHARALRGAAHRRCGRYAPVGPLIVLLALTACEHEEIENGFAAAEIRTGPQRADRGLTVAWNRLAYEVAFAEDEFLTFKGHRAFAMMHLAMHDALNSITPVYQRYAYRGERTAADPTAAAAQAAYEVLVAQYPDVKPRLDAELAAWLERVSNSTPRTRGIELGKAAAAEMLALRQGDGFDAQGNYTFRSGAGQYQTTPPWNGFVAQPGFRSAKPFALAEPDQFRPVPPPPLTGEAYALALNEVKDYGADNSPVRTEDQTAYAVWWMEFSEGSVNRLARQFVTDSRVDLWTANRMFAYLNMSLFDGYVAVWDAKYEYNHWRPYTAVRAADSDENVGTAPDSNWQPLRPTPPFPEYSSAHAAGCAASFEVLEHTFGNGISFTMETITAASNMRTRSFTSFAAAAAECADSRVRLGWHFRYATESGLAMGRSIARYVMANFLEGR